jgi:hypothetical protein
MENQLTEDEKNRLKFLVGQNVFNLLIEVLLSKEKEIKEE